jgi:CBS-domain-containing membrane protein
MTVYFGEADRWQHQPLAMALLEMLRREGCCGATITRGVASFGAGSRITTATLVDVAGDLPMVLTVVETPERVARLLPTLRAMVAGGLITVNAVDMVQYSSRFKEALPDVPVQAVMTTPVVTVSPDTPVAEAVRVLVQHVFTAVPVVDAQQHVLGMVHEVDLLQRGAEPAVPSSFPRAMTPPEQAYFLAQLAQREEPVAAVMRREVVPITRDTSIRTAAHLMLTSEVKQLPVVDAAGVLVGIVSRIDLLRSVSAGYLPHEGPHLMVVPTGGLVQTVSDVMRPLGPTVPGEASLEEVVTALLGAREPCVLVLDAAGCLAGIITPSDLVQRLDPEARPSFLQLLASHLPLVGQAVSQQGMRKSTAQCAQQVMTTPVVSVTPETPMSTALVCATQQGWKRLPVCDAQLHPLGLVSRKELLRAVVH